MLFSGLDVHWAPAVGYCLIYLSVNFRPQGASLAPAVGYCLISLSVKGLSGSLCRVLSDLFFCRFRASGYSLAPAVVYCLIFLSVNFGPQETLYIQLSDIVCSFSFCLSI